MEFTSIFLNKISKIEKKNVSRHKSVGFPAIFKKNLGNELWVRVVSHELPWSRDARFLSLIHRRSELHSDILLTTVCLSYIFF